MHTLGRGLFTLLLAVAFFFIVVPLGFLLQRFRDPLRLKKRAGWRKKAEMPPIDEYSRSQL